MTPKGLRLVAFQEEPGLGLVRGFEHDLGAEARTIGETIGRRCGSSRRMQRSTSWKRSSTASSTRWFAARGALTASREPRRREDHAIHEEEILRIVICLLRDLRGL